MWNLPARDLTNCKNYTFYGRYNQIYEESGAAGVAYPAIGLFPADALEQAVKTVNHRTRVFEITSGYKSVIEYLLDD
jgi:hypothetical protein